MEVESSFSSISSPVFDGENYQMWAVRMETYLEALDLWEEVEEDYTVPEIPANPTLAHIKAHKEKKTKKTKAKSCLFAAVSTTIFTRIMSLKSTEEIWDYLKVEYEGDERIRGMQVLNLVCDFELQKMKVTETVKEYAERLLSIANRVRLPGSSLADSRIMEKILVTLPEKFEATVTTLENTKDLSMIPLAEHLSALQAQEQRRAMRQEGTIEGALAAKHHNNGKNRKQKFKKPHAEGDNSKTEGKTTAGNRKSGVKKEYPPCHHSNKKGHPPFKYWRRPDTRCNKCNQTRHEAVICRNKNQQQNEEAKVTDQEEENQLFIATCFVGSESNENWLIDSGCTNHMTHDKELFRDLKPTNITKVRIGNGDYICVKGKGIISIASYAGTKLIQDVLFVPKIVQNLLSVGQLIEK
ncbi:aspartate and glycine-rich protein-like [Hibiscus syriacus]|uniref:Aspartate and glycine-rich protein-like n=1 Tax=Hibiscus syriacus TaxID=106335 RepID=A0A6A2Z857_HIBSY|nr:aspartate and glycine-rich protein-like [Hibiscus syriacus]